MTDLRKAAQQALEALNLGSNDVLPETYSQIVEEAITALRAALAEPTVKEFLPVHFLTDEQISDLWHQSGEQPFKFARMLINGGWN